MTTLLLRTFQARAGNERALLGGLRRMAANTLSTSSAEAVLICQQRDALEHFVWLEHANRNQAARHARAAAMAMAHEVCRKASPVCEIEFLGGFYRFPLPPCQVWSVHLQQSGPRLLTITKELLTLARIPREGSPVLGLSLYRAVGLPAALFGFFALGPRHDPAEILAARRGDPARDVLQHAEWRALQVRWTGGHIESDAAATLAISSSRYPRAAFWARSTGASGPGRGSAPPRGPVSYVREAGR